MGKSALYEVSHSITKDISIRVPFIRDIIDDEDDYYSNVSLIIATPYDMMVQLDDMNIDFTKISDWELFCLLFKDLASRDLSLIFGELHLSDFVLAENNKTKDIVLINPKTGVKIDRLVHEEICKYLRKILHIKKNDKTPGNEEAKQYLIERARKKLKRRKAQSNESQLEKYIISLVNTAEFPYTYESVLDLTITQFYASLYQIENKIRFDNLMVGYYAGTVDAKDIDQNKLNWIYN